MEDIKITYVPVSRSYVIEACKAGKTVYLLDKRYRNTFVVNQMQVSDLIHVLTHSDYDRYEFWYKESDENEPVRDDSTDTATV